MHRVAVKLKEDNICQYSWRRSKCFTSLEMRVLLALCHIYCKDEDHTWQSDCGLSRKYGCHSEGTTLIGKGPRGPLWGDFNHIHVELSLLGKEKKRLRVDKWWGNRQELAVVRTLCSHAQNMIRVLPGLPLEDEICVCSLPHQCCSSGERFSFWNPNFLGWKIHPQGLDEVRCCLFSVISSPEKRVNSWRKQYWTCIKFSCFNSTSHNSST